MIIMKLNEVSSWSIGCFRGLMVFAEDVLVRVGIGCAIVAFFSIAGGLTAVLLKLFGFATPGWFSVALGLLFLMFLQTGTLTLMTLMLTGAIRSGSVSRVLYHEYIAKITHAQASQQG